MLPVVVDDVRGGDANSVARCVLLIGVNAVVDMGVGRVGVTAGCWMDDDMGEYSAGVVGWWRSDGVGVTVCCGTDDDTGESSGGVGAVGPPLGWSGAGRPEVLIGADGDTRWGTVTSGGAFGKGEARAALLETTVTEARDLTGCGETVMATARGTVRGGALCCGVWRRLVELRTPAPILLTDAFLPLSPTTLTISVAVAMTARSSHKGYHSASPTKNPNQPSTQSG